MGALFIFCVGVGLIANGWVFTGVITILVAFSIPA